ncbi:hypothetical protein [Schlesneria paludicola]|uniref:hypothetical protein n=1 Tax=Schlesneria paludicola TaxID=360056 RepID=UPI0002DE987A|nr:hypothetical protein [Schlesneria paludicola]
MRTKSIDFLRAILFLTIVSGCASLPSTENKSRQEYGTIETTISQYDASSTKWPGY